MMRPDHAPGIPLLHTGSLEIPENSKVKVQVRDGGYIFYGICLQDPSKTKRPATLVLHKVRGRDLDDASNVAFTFDTREFGLRDIAELEIVGRVDPLEEDNNRPERLMVTQVVSKLDDVKNIMASIAKLNTKTVVVSGLIEKPGRFGKMGWICLVVRGLLICIDVVALENINGFWEALSVGLFRNQNIVKVCHNGRRLLDYLFHRRDIKIDNLYDTQIGEMYIRCHQNRGEMPSRIEKFTEGSPYNWEYYPVSKTYETFVPELLLPEELKHLEEFPVKSFDDNNPCIQRPIPQEGPYYKSVALEMKYLEAVYNAQMKTLLSHITLCMREQINTMYSGNNMVTMDRRYIPQNMMDTINKGSPYLSTDRSQDYYY